MEQQNIDKSSHQTALKESSVCSLLDEQQVDELFHNVGKELGRGAFCEVREVTTLHGKRFAMKELRRASFGATDLANEAILLSSLDHENIIHLHGISAMQEGFFFLILDRLETTLDQQIMETWKRPHDPNVSHDIKHLWERVEVGLQIAKGLQYLHSQNMVHRDVKPENIGLNDKGVAKLFDFGLAEMLHHKDELLPDICGTLRYKAPEVMLEQPNGMKVDVYGFGLVLWELCALDKAYGWCTSKSELVQRVAHGGHRPSLKHWWPRSLQRLIRKCWSPVPGLRPDMDLVVSTLQDILQHARDNNNNYAVHDSL